MSSTSVRWAPCPGTRGKRGGRPCPACRRGCSIVLDVRHLRTEGEEVLRIRPRYNPEVNGYWMCDEGRFEAYPRRGRGAFEGPLLRRGGGGGAVGGGEGGGA